MKIFRKLFCLAFAMTLGLAASAQEEAKAEFNPHLFLQLQGGAAYTAGETSFGDLISPAAAVNLGYKFSPVFGMRIGAAGWQGKGSWVDPRQDYKFKFVQGNLDLMLDLTNLFCGYNANRVFDSYIFLGGGVAVGLDNDQANAMQAAKQADFQYLWSGHKAFGLGRAGLGVLFNVSRHVGINVEVNTNAINDHFNSKSGSKMDWQINGLVGLTFKLGKVTKEPVPVILPVEVIEEPVEVVEEVVVVEEPAPAPAPVVVAPAKMTRDIFFLINSAVIRETEVEKVNELIDFLKEHPQATVVVSGYADKDTGTSAYNMQLSARRANAVAKLLEGAGIATSRITIDHYGSSIQPFHINDENRVCICVAEDK